MVRQRRRPTPAEARRAACLLMAAGLLAAPGNPAPARRAPEPLAIARDGRALVEIRIAGPAGEPERLAARELAAALQAMTGAAFPVREGGRPAAANLVLATRARPADGWGSEGYRLRRVGRQLRLEGDRPRATLYAVYDLLERLGCRWPAPAFAFYGGDSTLIPRRPRLSLTLGGQVDARPALAFRKIYVEEGHSHNEANLRQLLAWMPTARFNTLVVPTDYQGRGQVRWDNWRSALAPELRRRDLILEVGGHGYQNFLNAQMEAEGRPLFALRPDWFGADAAGQRRREPRFVFCTSNRTAVEFLTRRFLDYVRARPEIQVFDFWPPDGARWCECPACRALGAPTDRQARLVNEVREQAANVRPDLRLECLAYQTSIRPPESVRLDRRILLDFCPISQNFSVPIDDAAAPQNAAYAAGLRAWRSAFLGDISLYSYYRKYAWRSLPAVIPHYMERDLQWYRTLPVQGISTYGEPGDWGTYEVNHYVLGRLAWNPAADVDGILADFCRHRFGTAAPAAGRALAALEDIVRTCGSLPNTPLPTLSTVEAARKRLDAASRGLAEAGPAPAPGDRLPEQKATARLALALEYARRDLEIQSLRAARAPAAAIRSRVEALAAFLAAHAGDGVFLMHRRLELPALLQAYGAAQGGGES